MTSTAESNSQTLSRTLLFSALHHITRKSNKFVQDSEMNNSGNELSRHVIIANDLGLHARSASKIVKLVQNAESNVWIIKDGNKADASSIIDILTLASPKGSTITITIDDRSDLGILNNLVQLIENGFGE
jgi:phosphotransferase system HPr (HPr) family protein